MEIDYNKVAQRVYGVLVGAGYTPVMFDLEGNQVSDPNKARRFFVSDPNFMITVSRDTRELVTNMGVDTSIKQIKDVVVQCRSIAKDFMLKPSSRVFGKNIQPKDFALEARRIKERDDVFESKLYGGSLTSYQDFPDVKLIVKHRQPVSDQLHRSKARNIGKIYIQKNNQRQLFPVNYLPGARAMANHCAHAGSLDDAVGQQIVTMSENMIRLRDFINYSRRAGVVNEQNQSAVEAARAYRRRCRTLLDNLTSPRKYQSACQACEAQHAQADHTQTIENMFSVRHLDPKVERALDAVNHAMEYQNTVLSQSQQPHALNEWPRFDEALFEYESKDQTLGQKLEMIVKNVSHPTMASQHVLEVARRLKQRKNTDNFDREVVEHFVKNLRLEKT